MKQVLATATGVDRSAFISHRARDVLRRIGFRVVDVQHDSSAPAVLEAGTPGKKQTASLGGSIVSLGPPQMDHTRIVENLSPILARLEQLLQRPRYIVGSLTKQHIPVLPGVYVIYDAAALPVYAGKAEDLRFRIWENHCARRGDDNLVRYLTQEIGAQSRQELRRWMEANLSVQWDVEANDRMRTYLENLTLAALRPRLNRQ